MLCERFGAVFSLVFGGVSLKVIKTENLYADFRFILFCELLAVFVIAFAKNTVNRLNRARFSLFFRKISLP